MRGLQPRDDIERLYVRGALDIFPDFFRIATFIDSTHIKL